MIWPLKPMPTQLWNPFGACINYFMNKAILVIGIPPSAYQDRMSINQKLQQLCHHHVPKFFKCCAIGTDT